MSSWFQALNRTRQALSDRFRALFTGGRADARTLEEFEELLIKADVPPRLAAAFLEETRRGDGAALAVRLERIMVDRLGPDLPFDWTAAEGPRVLLLVGVNGSGKTTTAAKLARRIRRQGGVALLAAADTFRAAGTDQLRLWADRVGCDCVSGRQGSDAAAVAYDAVQAGCARHADWVLIDTAGRMHTRQPLMDELKKLHRAVGKGLAGAPHEVWMVLDAALGNNAMSQVRQFHACVPLTGLIVSKLDG